MPRVSDIVISKFQPILGDIFSKAHSEYWLDGGRGSTKSSFVSVAIILLIMNFPFANAVVVRRVSNTLADSVYNQLLWAISALGVEKYFKCRTSPLQITYTPTGQCIKFRGMDDPQKIKGTKFVTGYCAIQWFEELDQMRSWEDVSSALRSLKRGGSTFWTFYSYNPPKTLWSWVNRKAIEMERKPSCIVDHSTYLDVIESGHADWLGDVFIEDAEWLRQTNPKQYEWEMLGKITGTGGSVFDNIVRRKVTDAEIATFDRPRNGVDWGWFPDPWRYIRAEWQPAERRLIIFGEHSRNKTLPRDTGSIIVNELTYSDNAGQDPYYHDQTIWCDDTPDGKTHMAVYRRELGINARPARKGNMRMLSYQWLAGLREIVIDPSRCPLTYEEFTLKEYAKDKDGEWINDIPDGNDHSIDAVRYATMEDCIRSK